MRIGQVVWFAGEDNSIHVGQVKELVAEHGGAFVQLTKDSNAVLAKKFHKVTDYRMGIIVAEMIGIPLGPSTYKNHAAPVESMSVGDGFEEEEDEEE